MVSLCFAYLDIGKQVERLLVHQSAPREERISSRLKLDGYLERSRCECLLIGGGDVVDQSVILVEDVECHGVHLVGEGVSKLYVVVILESYAVVYAAIALSVED